MEHLTEDAIAGAASGLASRVLTAPLDVIKIRFTNIPSWFNHVAINYNVLDTKSIIP